MIGHGDNPQRSSAEPCRDERKSRATICQLLFEHNKKIYIFEPMPKTTLFIVKFRMGDKFFKIFSRLWESIRERKKLFPPDENI